jgi:protein involved in polysaccharide export with SLBB domain/capsular polysaccharide biosynthesis protein
MNGQNGTPANFSDDNPSGRASESDRQGQRRNRFSGTGRPVRESAEPGRATLTVDPWSLIRPALGRWYWLIVGGVIGVTLGGAFGVWAWRTYYVATAQIIRYDSPAASESYRPAQLNGPTLVGMLSSPDIGTRIGSKMKPPVPGGALLARIKPIPERQSDIVTMQVLGDNPRSAVELANLYDDAVIEFTQDLQRNEAKEALAIVNKLIDDTESDLKAAKQELPADATISDLATASPEEVTPASVSLVAQKIEAARAKLAELLTQYTDIHPLVRRKKAEIEALQQMIPESLRKDAGAVARAKPSLIPGTTPAASPTLPAGASPVEIAIFKVRELENFRRNLILRQRLVQNFIDHPPGYFRLMQPATMDSVSAHKPKMKIILVAMLCGIFGVLGAVGEVLRRELVDTRLKTEGDVIRVANLPVIASLGDLRQMSLAARESWAFRAWISLQDRLAYSPNHGLICGITSSNAGDGRSTWINLLAGAARKCGFRVLTIATRGMTDEAVEAAAAEPMVVGAASTAEMAGAANGTNGRAANGTHAANGAHAGTGAGTRLLSHPQDLVAAPRSGGHQTEAEFTALTASALFTPAMVTEKLMGTETDPLVHIPLPGWTWNLERRKQWQGALNVWRKIDNVVILVELPPASMPESVLLASNLPNLLWLVEANKSEAIETRAQLQTLRHARCNLVGAVINRAMASVSQGRFARWVGLFAIFAASLAMLGHQAVAAEALRAGGVASDVAAASDPNANGLATFSIVSPKQRAQWQQKLTLGPGDVLTFSLYGEPLLIAEQVPIGPDGRISYLEAHDIMAAGLTVDEFRDKLNEELGKYRRAPQAFVVPVAFKSKKYFVLGKVTQRGAFPLDRPTTLIEAVARARGMETGLAADRSMVELADLSRSFIARGGQKLPVDFEKLFNEGDLTQNVALEPNDYIYFPATDQKEVFVLGSVQNPGAYIYTTTSGAVGAIAARGGFTLRAWKNKLLVVRGSLDHPQTFVVDAASVLTGAQPDLKLQPHDIVYVSERPWIRAEELLDTAASAFVTSAMVTWTGIHVDTVVR